MAATLGAALFAAAVVLYVLHPILTGRSAPMVDDRLASGEADARRAVALNALRDVEYDYHTGKLDDQDYQALRGELTLEAVEALDGGMSESSAPDAPSADAALEDEVRRLREGLRSGDGCPRCGHLNPPGSRFCARCGEALRSAS